MTVQQCKYVIEIAKTGSFNEAASRLFVSQASLSESVKHLEEELGIRIFSRSNRGTTLTGEGNEFLQYAIQLVAQAAWIEEHYHEKLRTRRLCISSQHYDFVAEAFSCFLRSLGQHDCVMSLKETKTRDVLTDVKNSTADLGVIAIGEEGKGIMERHLKQQQIVFYPLVRVEPCVFLRKDHPLAKQPFLQREELLPYPYVYYQQGEHHAAQFVEELADFHMFEKTVEINDRATLMNLLMSTDCYTVGTGIMTSELNRGNIVSVKLTGNEHYAIGWIARENAVLSEEAMSFIDMLRDILAPYQ